MRTNLPVVPLIVLGLLMALTSACGGGSELVSLELDVASKDEAETDVLVEVVRNRLDALGLSDAEVVRSATSVEIRVAPEDEALVRSLIESKPVSVEFRPVLSAPGSVVAAGDRAEVEAQVDELRAALGVPDGVTAEQVADSEQAARVSAGEAATNNDLPLNASAVDVRDERFAELYSLETRLSVELTPAGELSSQESVTLQGTDGTAYVLGPVAVSGEAIEDATARLNSGDWMIELVFREGPEGIGRFNEIAATCSAGSPICPATMGDHGQLAVVVDGRVVSAPTITEASFERDQIQISGAFTEGEAKELEVSLRYGPSSVEVILKD